MEGKFFAIIATFLLVAISGCVQPPVCGNGICETGENQYNCPQDCGTQPVTHLVCKDNACVKVDGEGIDQCSTDTDCQAPPTHTECQKQQCVTVEGAGTDQCKADSDCVTLEQTIIGGGSLAFKDADGILAAPPFFITLAAAPSTVALEQTFSVNGQTFYAKCRRSLFIIKVKNGDQLNGFLIDINGYYIKTDKGVVNMATAAPLYLGGARFEYAGFASGTVLLYADGNCDFSKNSFTAVPEFLTINGAPYLNNTVYFDDDDTQRGPITMPLDVGNPALPYFKYNMHYNLLTSKISLLLSSQEFKAASGNKVSFSGTDTNEDGVIEAAYYKPDSTDFSGGNGLDTAYFMAQFLVPEPASGNSIKVLIDTNGAAARTPSFPNSNIRYYTGCVYYPAGAGERAVLECPLATVQYNEGESLGGLLGTGNYTGKEFSVKIAAVLQSSPSALYVARFELYDSGGNIVDSQTVGAGTYLDQVFSDAGGNRVLASKVFVSRILVQPTTSIGIVELQLVKGNGRTSEGSELSVSGGVAKVAVQIVRSSTS